MRYRIGRLPQPVMKVRVSESNSVLHMDHSTGPLMAVSVGVAIGQFLLYNTER
jgi:hypothetical protein